jgi:hypothetical protein
MMKKLLAFISEVVLFSQIFGSGLPGSDIQVPSGKTLLQRGPKGSKLYTIDAENSVYNDPVYLLDLTAPSAYEQGFDAGVLFGGQCIENYDSLMHALLGNEWWEPAVAVVVGKFLDWQWTSYLSVDVPQDFKDELRGLTDGGKAIGHKRDVGAITAWAITLANFPSDLDNLKFILQDEMNIPGNNFKAQLDAYGVTLDQLMAVLGKVKVNWNGLTCSMFGVWGSRTYDGRLFTGRNLDWVKDSGISKYKLITVHHPVDGFAHATFGWAGVFGAITGLSSQGLTVHEANLESDDITFRGFPWVVRLRYVMSQAKNLVDALSLFQNTHNTVGFNHGFGSAKDREAVLLETMAGHTAVFHANDVREQDLVVYGQQIGQAREEAIFRTNHGYDAYSISHFMWNSTYAYNNSILRYMVFPQSFDGYQTTQTPITYVEAINVT